MEPDFDTYYINRVSHFAMLLSGSDRALTEYEQEHCEQAHRFLATHHKMMRLRVEEEIRILESQSEQNTQTATREDGNVS